MHGNKVREGGWYHKTCVVKCLVRNPDLGIMDLKQIQQKYFCSMEHTATNICTSLRGEENKQYSARDIERDVSKLLYSTRSPYC